MAFKFFNQTETGHTGKYYKYPNILMFVSLQVNEDEKVSTVKELVSERLNIPANQQRLLYKGKALAGKLPLSHLLLPLRIFTINLATNSFCNWVDRYGYIDYILFSPPDEHRLSDYSIGPEAKLNLVIRPVGERSGASGMVASSSGGSSSNSQERVWQTVSTILSRHFSPADAAKVHEQLIKVYDSQYLQPCKLASPVVCNMFDPAGFQYSGLMILLVGLIGCWLVYFIVEIN